MYGVPPHFLSALWFGLFIIYFFSCLFCSFIIWWCLTHSHFHSLSLSFGQVTLLRELGTNTTPTLFTYVSGAILYQKKLDMEQLTSQLHTHTHSLLYTDSSPLLYLGANHRGDATNVGRDTLEHTHIHKTSLYSSLTQLLLGRGGLMGKERGCH